MTFFGAVICTPHTDEPIASLLKGTVSRDFRPSVFATNPTWVTDQQVKIFWHMVAHTQRNSRICVDSALFHIARSRLPAVLHRAESGKKIFDLNFTLVGTLRYGTLCEDATLRYTA
jgi:hypothetical protein